MKPEIRVGRFRIIVPNTSLLDEFGEFVGYLLSNSVNLRAKNAILRQTRDLLLPKLISGEVDVEGIDIRIGGELNDRGVFKFVRGKRTGL